MKFMSQIWSEILTIVKIENLLDYFFLNILLNFGENFKIENTLRML
jgi:hypothetical protein